MQAGGKGLPSPFGHGNIFYTLAYTFKYLSDKRFLLPQLSPLFVLLDPNMFSTCQQELFVRRVVRLMICSNTTKTPFSTAQLTSHVFQGIHPLTTSTTSSHRLLEPFISRAQEQLRSILGMEMVLISRQNVSFAQGQRRQRRRPPTSAYILVSTLPSSSRVRDANEFAALALMTVIASFIVLHPDCCMEEEELFLRLGRCGIHPQTECHELGMQEDGNFAHWIKNTLPGQWYLQRDYVNSKLYYSLGGRLRAELNDADILGFVDATLRLAVAVFSDDDEEGGGGGDELPDGLDDERRRLLQQRLDEASGRGD